MFKNYIETLLIEKGIDLNDTFAIILPRHAHVYEYGQFIEDLEAITDGDRIARDKIRRTFVKIDMLNGDVTDYVKHLATGIVKSYGAA